MEDWLKWWGGVPLNFPSQFPIRSVLPLRVVIAEPKTIHVICTSLSLRSFPSGPSFSLSQTDKAAWVDDQNIGEEAVLLQVLDAAGFNGQAHIKAAESAEVKEKLKANTARAASQGVCGVPSFQVDGGDVIWGQDRLNVVLDLLDGWTGSDSKPSHL